MNAVLKNLHDYHIADISLGRHGVTKKSRSPKPKCRA